MWSPAHHSAAVWSGPGLGSSQNLRILLCQPQSDKVPSQRCSGEVSGNVHEAPGSGRESPRPFLGPSDADVARRETGSLAAELNLHQHRRELAEVRGPGPHRVPACSLQGRVWEPELAHEPPGRPHPQALLGGGGGGDRKLLDRGPGSATQRLEVTSAMSIFSCTSGRRWSLGRLHGRLLAPSLGVLIELPPQPDVTGSLPNHRRLQRHPESRALANVPPSSGRAPRLLALSLPPPPGPVPPKRPPAGITPLRARRGGTASHRGLPQRKETARVRPFLPARLSAGLRVRLSASENGMGAQVSSPGKRSCVRGFIANSRSSWPPGGPSLHPWPCRQGGPWSSRTIVLIGGD